MISAPLRWLPRDLGTKNAQIWAKIIKNKPKTLTEMLYMEAKISPKTVLHGAWPPWIAL